MESSDTSNADNILVDESKLQMRDWTGHAEKEECARSQRQSARALTKTFDVASPRSSIDRCATLPCESAQSSASALCEVRLDSQHAQRTSTSRSTRRQTQHATPSSRSHSANSAPLRDERNSTLSSEPSPSKARNASIGSEKQNSCLLSWSIGVVWVGSKQKQQARLGPIKPLKSQRSTKSRVFQLEKTLSIARR